LVQVKPYETKNKAKSKDLALFLVERCVQQAESDAPYGVMFAFGK
jgi:hypothetical protein